MNIEEKSKKNTLKLNEYKLWLKVRLVLKFLSLLKIKYKKQTIYGSSKRFQLLLHEKLTP